MSSDIDALVGDLLRLRADTGTQLNPGLSADQINELEQQFSPFVLTTELRALYTAVDGTPPNAYMLRPFDMLTLQDAAQERMLVTAGLGSAELEWPPALLPIGALDGVYLCAALGKGASTTTSAVYEYGAAHGDIEIEQRFETLAEMLTVLVSDNGKATIDPGGNADDAGVFYLDERGSLPDSWFA